MEGQKIVPPIGPTNSPLLAICGEAPGADEERLGVPFVGASGHLLNQMLTSVGIRREDCYITNVSKVRPPANDFGALYYEDRSHKSPKPALSLLREQLRSELCAVKPSIVVALGGEALKALTPYSKIKEYRGTLCESNNLRVLPTYHPAYILRGMYEERPVVEADLKKALRLARSPSKPTVRFTTDPSFCEVMRFLHTPHRRLAFDIETTNNQTRMLGFAWSKEDAISIPFFRNKAHRWNETEEIEICLGLQALFASPCQFLAQNIMYDATVLAREFGFQITNFAFDTMLGHHLLYPELPKGLDFLSSIYTDHPMYWGEGTGATYNCYDCIVTFQAADEIELELRRRCMWDFYQNTVNPTVLALLYAQTRGVLIDTEARLALGVKTKQEMADALARLAAANGKPVSPNSPKQVSALVYDEWKLPVQYKASVTNNVRSKRPTVDDDALTTLARKHPERAGVINDLLLYRQKRVLNSTFIEMPLLNGRVYTGYKVAGTVTGRLSSSATFDGIGGNLQNIPRGDFRRVFTADPGCVLIKADLSQAEYRVLIWRARVHQVIEEMSTDPFFDIHIWNAADNIYRIPRAAITKDQRQNAKNGVYAANYGVGPLKVSRMYQMDFQEAKFIIERYHQAVPEVKGVYQSEIVHSLRTTRSLTNPLGRERLFLGRMDEDTFRAAYSHYCQSTVGDIINRALISLVSLGIDVLLQVHDELVVQCKEADVDATCSAVRSAMEQPLVFDGVATPLTIPCEIKVGPNWYDTTSLAKWKEGK